MPATAPAHIGEYVLLGELGHGGMGVVYRAEDPRLKREVALKVMLPQFASHPMAKTRFVREARAQAKVEHDHVVAILHIADHDGLPYIVMPLLKGMTLQAALRANAKPPLPEVIRIGRETAEGLSAAHEKGLVHRDIKPANIWLEGKKLRVKILDFGLARTAIDADATEGTDGTDGPVTREGAVVGTPAYMSPEQGRGLPVDGRTDLFSLGVVLYQMTTGELPFRGSTTLAILTALAVDNPAPPISMNPAVPQTLSDFVMRLLAKDPAYRPPTAEIAAGELRAIEAGFANAVRVIPLDSPPPLILSQVGPDPFAELDATEVDSQFVAGSPADTKPAGTTVVVSKPSGGFPTWAVVGGVLLAVVGVVGFVASQYGKKPVEEVKTDDSSPKKENPPLTKENTSPTAGVADRKAAEYVLGLGGSVKIEGISHELKNWGELQKESNRVTLTSVNLAAKPVTDVGLDVFKDCKNLVSLSLFSTPVSDMGVVNFKNCKSLMHLDLNNTKITDAGVANFKDCKNLTSVTLNNTKITDAGLASFKNQNFKNLTTLGLYGCPNIGDLTALKDYSNLKQLWLNGTAITDATLANLKGCKNLIQLDLSHTKISDAGLLHLTEMGSLTSLNFSKTKVTEAGVEGLAKALPKCKITTDADTTAWERSVAAMPPPAQVEAVIARLKERNPGFDGRLDHTLDGNAVTEVMLGSFVSDLSPLVALPKLNSLTCNQLVPVEGRVLTNLSPVRDMKRLTHLTVSFTPLSDLTPLKDLKLTHLTLGNNAELRDLTPLKGMKLKHLDIFMLPVTDLSPVLGGELTSLNLGRSGITDLTLLKDTKLTTLRISDQAISDLTPLKGMPLTVLEIHGTNVADLTPLAGMKLTQLDCARTKVLDLSPLRGMPLTGLFCHDTPVSDLSPLRGMPLEDLRFVPQNITAGLDVIREMKTLKIIGVGPTLSWAPTEFWDRYAKGEFKK